MPDRTVHVTFAANPAGRGRIEVDGHDISHMVTAVTIHANASDKPTVRLSLGVRERASFDGPAIVGFDDVSRAALIALGWKPPSELVAEAGPELLTLNKSQRVAYAPHGCCGPDQDTANCECGCHPDKP